MGSDDGLAPNRRQAIIWTNDGGFVYKRVYATLWLNELKHKNVWMNKISDRRYIKWNMSLHFKQCRDINGWQTLYILQLFWGKVYICFHFSLLNDIGEEIVVSASVEI